MTVFECETMTWGLEANTKFGGYKLPITLSNHTDIVESLEKLASDSGVSSPLYGGSKTLYLKLKALSNKQSQTILNKGRLDIKVKFEFTGMYEKDERKFMCFKVLGLGVVKKVEEASPEDL